MELPKLGARVLVRWDDTTNMAAWLDRDELSDFATDGAWHCQNLGFLTHHDNDCIVVSARMSQEGHVGLSERIPLRAVTSIEVV